MHCFLNFFKKTQAISLYRLAAQQQTSTSRRQNFHLFYPKFSAKFNKLSSKFWKWQEVVKKRLKLKQSRKPHICDIRGLRVNSRYIAVKIYLFKVNNKNTRRRCEICSKLTIKTSMTRSFHISTLWQSG